MLRLKVTQYKNSRSEPTMICMSKSKEPGNVCTWVPVLSIMLDGCGGSDVLLLKAQLHFYSFQRHDYLNQAYNCRVHS